MSKDQESITEKDEKSETEDVSSNESSKIQSAKKGKLILVFVIPILVLLLIGGLYFGGFLNKFLGKTPAEKKNEGPIEQQKPLADAAPLYRALDEFLVDIDSGSAAHFVKIEVTLKVKDVDSAKLLDERLPIVRDAFISYLRELKDSDLNGSGSLFVLKQELLMRVNKIVTPGVVDDVYIQNIVTR